MSKASEQRARAIAAGQTVPMRIGASYPVRMLREAYEAAYDRELARFNLGETPFWTHQRLEKAIAAGERAALELGRSLFPDRPIFGPEMKAARDRNVIAIAKKQATLRGWSDGGDAGGGFSFHDEPCEACKGDGYRPERKNQHEVCDQCRGDGFSPPLRDERRLDPLHDTDNPDTEDT